MDLKKLLCLGMVLVAASVQAASPTFNQFDLLYTLTNDPVTGPIISKAWREYGTNLLIVDKTTGDNTKAATDPYRRTWQTAFDLTGAGNTQFGAIAAAAPGDTILILPASTPYLIPSLPLSMKGLNLLVPASTKIQRTNFFNGVLANLGTVGPLIIPGTNSHITLQYGSFVTASNKLDADALIGWNSSATLAASTGISNNIGPTNFIVDGGGFGVASSDGVYISTAKGGQGRFDALRLHTEWDGMFFNDSAVNPSLGGLPLTISLGYGVHVDTGTNANTIQASHAIVTQCSSLTINGGVYLASGGTASSANNSALELLFTQTDFLTNGAPPLRIGTVTLRGPTFGTIGDPTNVAPIFNSGGAISGQSWWTETTASNNWSKFSASDYTGLSIVTNYVSDTNFIKSTITTGTVNANGVFHWNGGLATGGGAAYTNVTVAGFYLTNWDSTDNQQVRIRNSGGTVLFVGNQGFFGPMVATNSGVGPGPLFGASNGVFVVVNQVILGAITQTNIVDGSKWTNGTGRPVEFRILAFYDPASVAGLAAEDLLVDQTQSGTFVLMSRIGEQTIVGSIVETNYGVLSSFVKTNGVLTLTNSSTGAGNVAGIVTGSGQYIIH